MTILRNARREGSSIVFDGGFQLDRRGELRMEGPNSGRIPYHSVLQTAGDGMPPIRVQNLLLKVFQFAVNGIPLGWSSAALLFLGN